MAPPLNPSSPRRKEPPDKQSRDELSPLPRPTINTSSPNGNDVLQQPPASSMIRPPFAPFFTLITDNNTNATYHPRNVHYIFSDDDPSRLTSACLDIIQPQEQSLRSHDPQHQQQATSLNSSSATSHSRSPSDSTIVAGQKRASRPGQAVEREKEERILLLDLDASGQNVTRAQSLSSSWQILSTTLHPAPTWADSPSDLDSGEDPSPNLPSLMLKISGTDGTYNAETLEKGKGHGLGLGSAGESGGRGKGRERVKEKEGELAEGDIRSLVREFEERMRVLRRVVEAGQEETTAGNEMVE